MAETAQITSVDAIEAFRAGIDRVSGQGAAGAGGDLPAKSSARGSGWKTTSGGIGNTSCASARGSWRRPGQELFNATLSKLSTTTSLHQMAVQRADRAVRESEAKLKMVRKWNRELENRTGALVKQIEQFQAYLATDVRQAIAYLDRVMEALEAYANVGREKK